MDKFVGIITRTIYGTSGNELPPSIESVEKYGYVSNENETEYQFSERLGKIVIPLRNRESKPYSWPDGFNWHVAKINSL